MMRHGFLTLACGLAIGLTIPGYSGTPNPGQPDQAPAAPGNLAPAEAVKNFLDLVHAGKYAAASAAVADLLAAYPHDLRLSRAKELVDKAIAAETAQPVGAAAGKTTKPDLEASRRLVELAEQAKKTSDPARQKVLLRQFMNESGPFVEMHPDQQLLWEIRAAAALVLNDPMAGYEAGRKLQALGADGSTNRNLLQLLALLRAKGWQDEHLVGQAVEAATFTPGKGHTRC